jgi:hypothetical protein
MFFRPTRESLPALLLLLGCATASTPSLEPDSVQGKLQRGIPFGWEMGGTGWQHYDVYADLEIAHGGRASACLLAFEVDWRRRGELRQAVSARGLSGHRVRFRAWVRTNRVDNWCALYLRADSEDRRGVAFDDMRRRRIEGSRQWEEHRIVLDIPDDAVVVQFGAVMEGAGQMWVDDCALEVVGDSVGTTADFTRPTAQTDAIPDDLPDVPVNLDFEAPPYEYLYE